MSRSLRSPQIWGAHVVAPISTSTCVDISIGSLQAADGDEALMKKLERMERRIQSLEAELKQKQTPPSDKSAQLATVPASPKNANAAVPSDKPQDPPGKPASKSKPRDALTPSR